MSSCGWAVLPQVAQAARQAQPVVALSVVRSAWAGVCQSRANGLLRQYWPKGADLRHLTQADCASSSLSVWSVHHSGHNSVDTFGSTVACYVGGRGTAAEGSSHLHSCPSSVLSMII
jgi:hypothetical protein